MPERSRWRTGCLSCCSKSAPVAFRTKAGRSEAERGRLQPEMDALLGGLIALDAARAAVLSV